jgi:hypothetical protein
LDPSTIEDKLWDGTLSYVRKNKISSPWSVLYIDFFVGDVMSFKEAFGLAAVAAPEGGVDGQFHRYILLGLNQSLSLWLGLWGIPDKRNLVTGRTRTIALS